MYDKEMQGSSSFYCEPSNRTSSMGVSAAPNGSRLAPTAGATSAARVFAGRRLAEKGSRGWQPEGGKVSARVAATIAAICSKKIH